MIRLYRNCTMVLLGDPLLAVEKQEVADEHQNSPTLVVQFIRKYQLLKDTWVDFIDEENFAKTCSLKEIVALSKSPPTTLENCAHSNKRKNGLHVMNWNFI